MVEVKSGRWRAPRTAAPGAAPVPGEVHVEQLVPLLVERFGDDWWRRGGVSLRFVSTTISGEQVRAYRGEEEAAARGHYAHRRCRVWMNAEGEALILKGTAALGEDPGSELLEATSRAAPGLTSTLFPGLRPGQTSSLIPVSVSAEHVDARLPTVTEPLACYREPGRRTVPPASLLAAMQAVEADLIPMAPPADRLLGGLELRYLNGPAVCDRAYRVQGRVLALDETDRDEILWYQAELEDQDGNPVARVLRMERFGRRGAVLSRSSMG